MALRPELTELLSGFEKRMKFINIVRFLLDYSYPDSIRKMIPDKMALDNLVVAVLVFIKERTLGSEQTCTKADVEGFLADLTPILPEGIHVDEKALAKYIIVDILQNGGVLTEYLTYDSEEVKFTNQSIRLINEEKGAYHLTDDAFDFLFRSKEIESELDYSVTRFRMKEYMKRNNYEKALDASRELVSRIRSLKINMDDFLTRCRENISRITVDQYDSIIGRIRSLLDDEYQELTEIQNSAKERAGKLLEAQQSGIGNEETKKHRADLSEIINNIALTIEEQRTLINKKTSLSESYQTLIRDSFLVSRFERMNFERDILSPLRKSDVALADAAKSLLFPLTKPTFDNVFSVENFYAPQTRIRDLQDGEGVDVTSEEPDSKNQIALRNERFKQICNDFFAFVSKKESFFVSDFIHSMRVADLFNACEENALPNTLLSLYALQELDIEGWKDSEKFVSEPNGEFELSWCLVEMPKEFMQIRKLIFSANKEEKIFQFTAQMNGVSRRIDISDFQVEVIR